MTNTPTGTTIYDQDRTLESLTIHQLLLEMGRTFVLVYSSDEAKLDPEVIEVGRRELNEFMRRSPDEREKGMTTNP